MFNRYLLLLLLQQRGCTEQNLASYKYKGKQTASCGAILNVHFTSLTCFPMKQAVRCDLAIAINNHIIVMQTIMNGNCLGHRSITGPIKSLQLNMNSCCPVVKCYAILLFRMRGYQSLYVREFTVHVEQASCCWSCVKTITSLFQTDEERFLPQIFATEMLDIFRYTYSA